MESISFIDLMDIQGYCTLDREKIKSIESDIKKRRFFYERLEVTTFKNVKHLLWIKNDWEYETFQALLHKILQIKRAPDE